MSGGRSQFDPYCPYCRELLDGMFLVPMIGVRGVWAMRCWWLGFLGVALSACSWLDSTRFPASSTSIYFQRFDAAGVPTGPRHEMGSGALVSFPALAHGGGRWAVARLQGGRLYLWLLDAAGTPSEIDLGALPGPANAGPAERIFPLTVNFALSPNAPASANVCESP